MSNYQPGAPRVHHPHHQHPPPSPKGPPGQQQHMQQHPSQQHPSQQHQPQHHGPPPPVIHQQQQQQQQQIGPSRVMDLLEALKHEVEVIHEEASFSKHHRKDLEQKLVAQISEVSGFQKSLYDLDRMHHAIKTAYEEDIKRLRHELESRGIPIPPSINPATVVARKPSLAPEDMNKRLKDANSNPVPSPRYGEIRTTVAKPLGAPPNFSNQYRQSAPQTNGYNPSQYGAPPQQQQQLPPQPRTNTPPGQQQHAPQAVAPAASKPDEVTLVANPKIQNANLSVDQLHIFEHNSVVCCVKFSPDGNYLATGCNHFAQIFEISSGRKILALIDESVPKTDDLYIRSVCFSPDGVYLATGAEDRVVRIWDIVNGRIKLKLVGHRQDIYSLDWTKDGRFIVSGSGDHTVKVWDPETGACIRTLQNGNLETSVKDAGITCVAIQPTDGRGVVAASLDEVIRVWDLRTGFLLERFEGHENSVYSVAFSPDGHSIVSGSLDQTLRIWDLSQQTLATLSSPPSDRKPEVVVTKKHRHAFVGHRDYVLSVGYPGSHSTIGRVDSNGAPIQDPSFDVEWVISGSKDRLVLFWDAKNVSTSEESQPLLTMSGHKNSVISIAMGPSGGLLATGSGDLKARIWRVSRAAPTTAPPQAPVQVTTAQNSVPAAAVPPPKAPSPSLGEDVSSQSNKPLAPILSLPVVKPVSLSKTPPPPENGEVSPAEKLAASPPLGSPQLARKQLEEEEGEPESNGLNEEGQDDDAMDE